MRRFLIAALLAAIALPAAAFDTGARIGLGQVGVGASSLGQTGVASMTQSNSAGALIGTTAGQATSAQGARVTGSAYGLAGCLAAICGATAGNSGYSGTNGVSASRTRNLGLGGSNAIGAGEGQATGTNIGAGQANYTFGNLFTVR